MRIAGIQRASTIDFPGALCCVLFTRGCDLDCFYCHNRELILPGPCMPMKEVMAFLEKRRGLLEGVAVSGGEPTLQPDLPGFLRELRELGYRVKLDTNGARPGVVEALIGEGLADYYAVDYKARQADYPPVCGGEGEKVKETLKLLLFAGAEFEARTTLYPGLDLDTLFELLGELPPLPRWRLNFFHQPETVRERDEERLGLPALARPEVKAALPALKRVQPNLIY